MSSSADSQPQEPEAEPAKPKAIGYTRVSTGEQAEGGSSLDEQEQRIRDWAEREGYEPELLTDAGLSGRRDDRPALAEAIERPADAFVVAKLDRLGRGARYLLELFERFEAEGTRFVALSDGIDTATMGGKTIMRFLAVIAETESDNIAERNRMAAASLYRQGRYSGPAPLGYEFCDATLTVIPHEAEIVRRIFGDFVGGRSLSEIARSLNADAVATKRGGRWRQGSLGTLIRNPLYAGRIRRGEAESEGIHERIIDEELFGRAQRLAAAMSTRKGGSGGRPPAANHLFTGKMLRCGSCGEAMSPRTPYNRAHASYYHCSGAQNLGCSMPQVRRERIDTAVYSYFEQVGLDVEATREAIEQGRDRRVSELTSLLAQAEQESQRAQERLDRVRRDYTDGRLDAADWREFKAELTGEQEAATAEVERLRASLAEARGDGSAAETETLRRLAAIRAAVVGEVRAAEGVDAVRSALLRMFDRFILHRADDAPSGVHSAELALVPGYVLEPIILPEAIAGQGEHGPLLRRGPLEPAGSGKAGSGDSDPASKPLEQAGNNQRQGVGWQLATRRCRRRDRCPAPRRPNCVGAR